MEAKRNPETKDFNFQLESMDEGLGTFSGYASTWDEVDSYGDQVVKGAFKKSLKEKKAGLPMLWSHQVNEPIGLIFGEEDERGLAVRGQFNLEDPLALRIRSHMKQGSVTGLSIGFQTVVEELDKATSVRKLKEIKLWEISPVVFPACLTARVSEVKGDLEVEAIEDKDLAIAEGPEKSTPEAGPDTFHPLYVRAMAGFLKSQHFIGGN
jgi:HK97 family phage prohead protease